MSDIAAQAGVSKMTVSKVVNNRPGISGATRQRVMDAAALLGYGTAPGELRTGTLGMIVPALDSQYLTEIMRGADITALEAGLELLISTIRPSHGQQPVRWLSPGQIDGLLLVLPSFPGPYEQALRELNLPAVVVAPGTRTINSVEASFPSIDVDHYTGARQAMDHLLALGHRRIGFIGGSQLTVPSQERLRGYREGLLTAGLPLDPVLEPVGDFSQPTGFRLAGELLGLPQPPTAIFAANDSTAFGAIEAIKHRGLRVPDDVSVIGFDDIPQASQVFPPLTTIRQPLLEMGAAGMRQLLNVVQGVGAVTSRLVLPTELVIRNSTAAVP